MKRGKFSACWRPLMGVAAVGALALGVSAPAAPRGSDDSASRGTTKGATEVTRLVTGDPTQINSVIAGSGATTILAVDPVASKVGSYPAGTTITAAPAASSCTNSSNDGDSCTVNADCTGDAGSCGGPPTSIPGQCDVGGACAVDADCGRCVAKSGIGKCINSPSGGFRLFAEAHVSNWDNNFDGSPLMKVYQIKIDGQGYMDSNSPGDQPNIVAPLIPCPGADPTPCVIAFGEGWATCATFGPPLNGDFCEQAYNDASGTGRPDMWCAPSGGNCFAAPTDVGDQLNFSFRWVGVSNLNAGRADHKFVCSAGPRTGQTCNTNANCGVGGTCGATLFPDPYYGGSLVMDVPSGAKGRYNVRLSGDETFAEDGDANQLEILEKNGYCVNIITGSCCSGLGGGGGTCTDDLTAAECALLPSPRLFTGGGSCANPPTADGCAECLSASDGDPGGLCDDQDACTEEDCDVPNGICVRSNKAGWATPAQQASSCCNPSNGVIASKDDGNACTDDACSGDPTDPPGPNDPKAGNGTPTHTPSSAATPCDDLNPCTAGDHCVGDPSTACTGTDVNTIPCLSDADCPLDPGGVNRACVNGFCFCTATPDLDVIITNSPKSPECEGGARDGAACGDPPNCPGGECNEFANGGNCFDEGEKVLAVVRVGAAAAPINGGQFLITYDPSCLDPNSATCLAPYTTTVYGPVFDRAAGTIFIVCGVDPFAGIDGPPGNVNMVALGFRKLGECNECEICFDANNPQNTYLVDDEGQRVDVNAECKAVRDEGDLELDTPDNIKTNRDCDGPTAVVTWASPTASHSCSDVTLSCRGAHESGLAFSQGTVMNGGEFPSGSSSFCCFAEADDPCGATAGCSGPAGDCAPAGTKPEGCWTVEVNDETSLDVDVQLCPPITHSDPGGELTRCIKFCLFSKDCLQEPVCFEDDVTFGGLFNFVGKSRGKVKIDGTQQWGCITAQDMLHTLRSCYVFDASDCINGQLHAQFSGAPEYSDSHCLIGGNLDGWKKDDPTAHPSLDVIDILDFGTFVSQFPRCYADNDTPCATPEVNNEPGPNADINGDGCVTVSDYNFIVRNFLTSAKDCCCGPQAASLPPALTEISVDELRQMGLDALIVADLNGDGLVNSDDMDAFTQGARPTKSHDRKGGKGLRSGR